MSGSGLLHDPVVQGVLRAALGLLLAGAALHKLRDPAGFRVALAGYALLPGFAVGAVARLLPLAEALAAVALWTPGAGPARVLPAAALLGLYSGAIAAGLLGGRRGIDCGCGASGAARPLAGGLLARNALLIAAALLCALPVQPRALAALDWLCLWSGTLALLLLYGSAERAGALAPRLRALRSAP